MPERLQHKGVTDPIFFQITAQPDNLVDLKGEIPGKNYIDADMSPDDVNRYY